MANNDYDKLIKSASEKLGSSPEALRRSIEKKDLPVINAHEVRQGEAPKGACRQGADETAEIRRLTRGGAPAAWQRKITFCGYWRCGEWIT